MKKITALCAGALAAASVSSAETGDSSALAKYDRTGETTNCVNMRSTTITPADDGALLFRVGVSEVYVNEPKGGCKNADSPFTRFELSLFGSQICRGEIVKLVDQSSGMFKGACVLGTFEKLVKKPPAEAAD